MAEALRIKPDAQFVNQVMNQGGDTLKKCFQCATCGVVCTLSPDNSPFPRQEMIWAQWGLKDKLVKDPNIWLCHQCNDCSTYCPRGARPGDVFAALRSMTIKDMAFPKFMGKILGMPAMLPFVFIIPIVLLLLVLKITHGTFSLIPAEAEPVEFAKLFSHLTLNVFFPFFTGLATLAFLVGGLKLWKQLSGKPFTPGNVDLGRLIKSLISTIIDILLHRKFKDCGANKIRYWAHLGVFYGFIGLLVTTVLAIVIILIHIFIPETAHSDKLLLQYPMPLAHPIKWLGNFSAAIIFIGCCIMVYNRLASDSTKMKSSYFDWFFLLVLFTVVITGILSETMRLVESPDIAYPIYFIHLVAIFALLIYSPYSKFAHFLYRAEAMVYARYMEEEQAGAIQEAAAAEPAQASGE